MLRTLLGLGLAAATAAVPRVPAGADEVRVLLFESAEAVEVAGVRVAPEAGGLRADGVPVGSRWRARGAGPHRAGALRVRGVLDVERSGAGLRVINEVDLEDYVAGTLGREVYPGWHEAALRAQAVVTRTYALHQRERSRGRSWALESGTAHQVYGGVEAETPRVRRAVADTRGEILTWRGRPILAAFHSASGGRTASAEEVWGRAVPYLQGREVPGEEISPDTYWRAAVTGTKLGRALAPLGLELGVVREARVEDRSPSGRALRVVLRGAEGSGRVEARALRSALGLQVLRSTLFEIRQTPEGFVFVGSGYGHGVGMSQWGAQAMARRGASYREILAAFYPGTRLPEQTLGGTRLPEHTLRGTVDRTAGSAP